MKFDMDLLDRLIAKVNTLGLLSEDIKETEELATTLSLSPAMKDMVMRNLEVIGGPGGFKRNIEIVAILGTIFQMGFEVGAVWAKPELEGVRDVMPGEDANAAVHRWLGAGMLIAPFVAMFGFLFYIDWEAASVVFGSVLLILLWVTAAAYLLSRTP